MGTTPWTALVFLTFWMQLQGVSDLAASLLLATFLAANAAGAQRAAPPPACPRLLHHALCAPLCMLPLPPTPTLCPPSHPLPPLPPTPPPQAGCWGGTWATGRPRGGQTTAA